MVSWKKRLFTTGAPGAGNQGGGGYAAERGIMKIDGYDVEQIQLPETTDTDPHPRIMFDGYGLDAGQTLKAWLPGGWQDITLEVAFDITGSGCWYISGRPGLCPIGLYCRV